MMTLHKICSTATICKLAYIPISILILRQLYIVLDQLRSTIAENGREVKKLRYF